MRSMTRPASWTRVKLETLQRCRIFDLVRDWSRSPRDGEVYDFFRIEAGDWVNVIPLTPEGEVVMVAQYRHGAGKVMLEIPGGMVDPGEDPIVAGARELLEETGYAAGRMEPLGDINPNPALFGNRVHFFVAHDVSWKQAIQNSGREETSVELVARDALPELVRSGEIDHALIVSAFYRLDHHGKGETA